MNKKINIRGGFSDRNKIKPLNTIIQYESLDEHTRNSILIMISKIIERLENFVGCSNGYELAKILLVKIFNEPVLSGEYHDLKYVSRNIGNICLHGDYDDVLTMFESICQLVQEYEKEYKREKNPFQSYDDGNDNLWFDLANQLFEKEFVGYKFVNEQICKITSQTEIDSIMEAVTTPYTKVNEHIQNAISLLKETGIRDYKNSIKESVLSLECLLNIVLEQKGLVLSNALNLYFKNVDIHPALKESLSKLYAFASDSSGIRHDTNKIDYNVGFNEAKLILVTVSGFINYIIPTKKDDLKSKKAGVY